MEAAFIIPLLLALLVGGLMFGVATIDQFRLERAAADAALLPESTATQIIAAVDGRLVCWWQGDGEGECFPDDLIIERTQVVAVGRTWTHPVGSFQPRAEVSRPIGGSND